MADMANPGDKTLSTQDVYRRLLADYAPPRLFYRVASDSWELEGRAISGGELAKLIAFELECGVQKATIVLAKAGYDSANLARTGLEQWLARVEELPKSDVVLRTWLKAMERRTVTGIEHEANVAAMKQWLWMVKRSILERPVVWQVAPIFWSPEGGTGKSFNIRRLIEPLAAFTRHVNVDDLGERFSGKLFARTLIAFLDEFAGAESASAMQLKAILTGKPIDMRSMFSESGFYSANRMSCIATSNLAPPHGFVDHTGARRFWSIHCHGQAMGEGERMKRLDNIVIDHVWACVRVDERAPHYDTPAAVLEYMDEVRNSRLRSRTSLEEFCSENLEAMPGHRITLKDFQTAYRSYCEQTKQRAVKGGYRVFSDLLKEMGYDVVKAAQRYSLKHHNLVDMRDPETA